MKLVEFDDGKFGVRRGFIFYEYKDLESGLSWRSKDSCYFYCCKSDLKTAVNFIKESKKKHIKERVLNYREFEKYLIEALGQNPLEELKELLDVSLKPEADIIRINFLLDLVKK